MVLILNNVFNAHVGYKYNFEATIFNLSNFAYYI